MKVAFITVHVGFNFGSRLQAIATQSILNKMGCDEVVCINYIPPRVELKRYWVNAFQSPVRFIRRFFYFPFYLYSKHKYDGYLRKFCNISKPIYEHDNFEYNCPKADIYVSGSDQIWNYKHNEGLDTHYFFEGIKGVKIAYASSIGISYLPSDYAEYMKSQLKSYKAISVRESSAVKLLNEWGISSTLVLDPTLMLDKDEWRIYSSKRLVNDHYVFVYLPYNVVNKCLIYKTVRLIAKKRKLTVVTYSDSFVKDKDADLTITFVTPGDILSLFYYADFIVTNSFHGTAFSINLNKQFWVYKPTDFSSRITNILDLCQIPNRLLDKEITIEKVDEIIDFSPINEILKQERKLALDYLAKSLN